MLVGILVGGRSSRMGGEPKGLLPAPDDSGRTLIERLIDEVTSVGYGDAVVLQGELPAYAALGVPALPDARSGSGPLGGLVALLREAERRGDSHLLAFSCDLPFLSGSLIVRLASEAPEASVLCPRNEGKYEPLMARYAIACSAVCERALAESRLALQPLLGELGAKELVLSEAERRQIIDWDEPRDLRS